MECRGKGARSQLVLYVLLFGFYFTTETSGLPLFAPYLVLPLTGQDLPSQSAPAAPPTSSQIIARIQHLIALRDLLTAREELDDGLKRFPHNAELLNFRGVVNAQEDRQAEAESDFQRAIREAPHYAGAYLNLGHLYQLAASKDSTARKKAIATYESLLEFDSGNEEANFQSAFLLMQQGTFQASLAHLRRLPSSDQDSPQVLAVFCADDAGMGESSQAIVAASHLLADPKLSEGDILAVLPTLDTFHQRNMVIRLAEGLRQRRLASAGTLMQLGAAYEELGRHADARLAFQQAAALQPERAEPLFALARVANRQEDYREALGYLRQAHDLDPQNATILFMLGLDSIQLDLYQEAYDSLKMALALEPNNPKYNYVLGAICVERHNPHEAITLFENYSRIKPADPQGKLALAEAYYFDNELESASKTFEAVIASPTTAGEAFYYLGRIASDERNWPEATRNLRKAIRSYPKYPDAYAVLGRVYLDERKYPEAEKALTEALQLDPQNYMANFSLMVLYGRTKDKRADSQSRRFAEITQEKEDSAKSLLRTIKIVP